MYTYILQFANDIQYVSACLISSNINTHSSCKTPNETQRILTLLNILLLDLRLIAIDYDLQSCVRYYSPVYFIHIPLPLIDILCFISVKFFFWNEKKKRNKNTHNQKTIRTATRVYDFLEIFQISLYIVIE